MTPSPWVSIGLVGKDYTWRPTVGWGIQLLWWHYKWVLSCLSSSQCIMNVVIHWSTSSAESRLINSCRHVNKLYWQLYWQCQKTMIEKTVFHHELYSPVLTQWSEAAQDLCLYISDPCSSFHESCWGSGLAQALPYLGCLPTGHSCARPVSELKQTMCWIQHVYMIHVCKHMLMSINSWLYTYSRPVCVHESHHAWHCVYT